MVRRLLASLAMFIAFSAVPVAQATQRIVEVPLSPGLGEVALLEDAGLDVTHDITPRRAVVVLRDDAELARLRDLTPFTVVDPDYGATRAQLRADENTQTRLAGRSALPSGRERYRVLDEYDAEMAALIAGHPGLVRPITLPTPTFEGRDIRGVEIAGDVNRGDDGRPVYVVMGAHHAREWPSAEVSMEWALDLGAKYGVDPRVTAMLDSVRVIVIPVVNRDGFIVSRGTNPAGTAGTSPSQRKNCKPMSDTDAQNPCGPQRLSTDLNRNYGAFWGGNGASVSPQAETYRGSGPYSEPESRSVHEFSQRLHITNFQTIHNLATVVLRPPGFRAQGLAPDEPALAALGDAMARAAGYASEFGFELYEVTGATEDWNYASQNSFAYTIELGGQNGFQGPYQRNVVDQYLGTTNTPAAGRGVREALLLAGEQAGDPAGHSVLSGSAPAGRTLRLRKEFITKTSEICIATSPVNQPEIDCGARLPAIDIPDFIDTTLTVPDSGNWTWHVNPSTRPFVRKAGQTEAWTLTCEQDGTVLRTQAIEVAIGEAKAVEACSAAGGSAPTGPSGPSGPVTAPADDAVVVAPGSSEPTTSATGTPPTAGSAAGGTGGAGTATAVRRAEIAVDRTSRARTLARGIRARARCTTDCVLDGRLTLGGRTVGRAKTRLAAGQRRTFVVRLTRSGRRALAARRPGRARIEIVIAAKAGPTTLRTVRQTVTL